MPEIGIWLKNDYTLATTFCATCIESSILLSTQSLISSKQGELLTGRYFLSYVTAPHACTFWRNWLVKKN